MKKLLLVLLIGMTFIGCKKDKEIVTVYVDRPPVEDCNCGTVKSSITIWQGPNAPGGPPYATTITGNCGTSWSGLTDQQYGGDVCEWEIETTNGSPANW